MISPEQALDTRCELWEEQIDAQLREHNWERDKSCEIEIPTSSKQLVLLLTRYEALGWRIYPIHKDTSTTTFKFVLHVE